MKTALILRLAAATVVLGLIVSAFLHDDGCPNCGAAMRPMDGFPQILDCTACPYQVDTSYQR